MWHQTIELCDTIKIALTLVLWHQFYMWHQTVWIYNIGQESSFLNPDKLLSMVSFKRDTTPLVSLKWDSSSLLLPDPYLSCDTTQLVSLKCDPSSLPLLFFFLWHHQAVVTKMWLLNFSPPLFPLWHHTTGVSKMGPLIFTPPLFSPVTPPSWCHLTLNW